MLSEESNNVNDETNESLQKPYKIVVSHSYPMRRETRSRERIIFDECNYKLYQLAEASKSWEESEPSFIDLNLLLDCEKISEQNASLQELCDILQSNGFEVEAMPDSDSFGAYVPSPEQGNLLKGIDNSLLWLPKLLESFRSKIYYFFFISTFTTFELLHTMLATYAWFPFRRYFLEKITNKKCNSEPFSKKCVTEM